MTGEILVDIGIYTALAMLLAVPIAYFFAAIGEDFLQASDEEQDDELA